MTNHAFADPIHGADRIASLDVLRGFAVLGILIMNIQSFSIPSAAYISPTPYGDVTDYRRTFWLLRDRSHARVFTSSRR